MYKGRRNASEKGFSILEILVAMVIFLIVTGSIYGLLQIGRIDRNRSSRRSDVLKNARVAVHLVGRDALNAGLGYNRVGALTRDDFLSDTFNNFPVDVDDERDFITSVIPADNRNPNDLGGNPTDFVAFCTRDMDFNLKRLLKLRDVNTAGTDPIVETEALTGASVARVNQLYLIESDRGQTAFMATAVPDARHITAAPTDPLGINQPLNGVGQDGSVLRECLPSDPGPPAFEDANCTTYIATLKRFDLVSYHVNQDGSLIRTTYGNNLAGVVPADQVQERVLAYNVADFQLEYVLSDGTVTTNPTIASPGPDNLWTGPLGTEDDDNIDDQVNLIRQINISITVLATERDEQSATPERITLRATFSTRNMEYTAG